MNNSSAIIFVVGNSRSGTTMMSRILGRHPDIFSFNELHFIENQVSPEQIRNDYHPPAEESITIISTLLRSQREGLYSKSDRAEYHAESVSIANDCGKNPSAMDLFACYCMYETGKHHKAIATEQTPKNIYYVEEIITALPNSKFIHMYRDPRDVMLSQKRRWKRRFLGAKQVPLFRETIRSWLNYHPITMSKLWSSAISESFKFGDNDNFLNIKFESLLDHPNSQIQQICNFLGIEFDENMLKVPQVGSSSGMDKVKQIGIDKTRQGNWNHDGLTRGEIGICQNICALQMTRLGYEVKKVNGLWFWWTIYGMTFLFKMIGALIFNLGRTKNILSSIKRRIG